MTPIHRVAVTSCTIPTDQPESDGTLAWDSTTVVVVELAAGGEVGLGWTYADRAAADVVARVLAPMARGHDALAVDALWDTMVRGVRNVGRRGLVSMAISAVDTAAWDLRARLLGQPLCEALGALRDAVPAYGSGGFCSYDLDRLAAQLGGWVADGIPRVKMKVGRDPRADERRVDAARDAIGGAELFVDANGAYDARTAVAWAVRFAERGVTWFEEPVSSDDVAGLAFVRDHAPAGVAVAAGEYASTPADAALLLDHRAVDCLQADVTRCGGFTGFLRIAALCDAAMVPLSAHCAPQLSAQVAVAAPRLAHVEWFHDHVRVDRLLFDGVLRPVDGALHPDRGRAGHGMLLKAPDAVRWAA